MTNDERTKAGWLAIFKTGRHTDMAKRTNDFTEQELDAIASAYDPAVHEAPVVLGHPKIDAPAYGWAERLERDGEILWAKPRQVAAEFADWVRQGLYRKVSAAFYDPDSPGNPTPGKRYLHHIGFLGATPPSIKGLPQAAFADGETWSYMEPYQERTIKGLFARLRDWLIQEKGLETADKIITPWDLEALEVKPAPDVAPGYTEPGALPAGQAGAKPPMPRNGAGGDAMKEWLQKLQASLVALFAEAEKTLPANDQGGKAQAPTITMYSEADVKAREEAAAKKGRDEALAQAAREQRARDVHAKVTAFVESHTKTGTYLPAWSEQGLPAVLEQVLLIEAPLQFAEGKDPKNPGEILLAVFGTIPKMVEFKEVAKPAAGDLPAGQAGTAGAKLDALTKARSDEKKIPYGAAFAEVQKANPDLATQYAEEMRGKN